MIHLVMNKVKIVHIVTDLLFTRYWFKVATLISVYADWDFAQIEGIGWRWAVVIWLYTLVTYFPLDLLKLITQ